MSIIKSIYNAPIEYEFDGVQSLIKIKYNGKVYLGEAIVHTRDYPEFASEKVGLNIALSRARIKILKAMKERAKLIADTRYQMYKEATGYINTAEKFKEVDPTGKFFNIVSKAQLNYKAIKNALKKEQKYLNQYLEDQDKMVETIRAIREKARKE